jgi:hypothetical protein
MVHPGYPNGAATGLLVKDYLGKDANQEVWKFPSQAPHLWFQLLAGQKVCSCQQSLFGQPTMPALVSQLPDSASRAGNDSLTNVIKESETMLGIAFRSSEWF